MKTGALADAAVNEIRSLRVMQRIYVRFAGHEERWRRIRKLTEDRLTPYDNYLCVLGNSAGGSDQVFKLGTRHECLCALPVSAHPQKEKTAAIAWRALQSL